MRSPFFSSVSLVQSLPSNSIANILNFLLVFIGGGLGSCLRYAFSLYVVGAGRATFLANLGASLLIGFLAGLSMREEWRLLLATGFCGGFSTFSTFSHDNLLFLQHGNYLSFALNVLLNVAICLIAVFLGYWLLANG